jgi:hypothetical protein
MHRKNKECFKVYKCGENRTYILTTFINLAIYTNNKILIGFMKKHNLCKVPYLQVYKLLKPSI